MDAKPAPQSTDAFELSPAHRMYSGGDMRIAPRYYFETRYGVTCHSIDDNRGYSPELRKYLMDNGATLVESSESIPDSGKQEVDDASLMWGPDEHASHLYWYKGNLVAVHSMSESGECEVSIDITHPLGVSSVLDEFKSFIVPRKAAAVGVLMSTQFGLKVKSVDFAPPTISDLDLNYGSGFKTKAHDPIIRKLNERKAGLMLFHGAPGTGKSTYIKLLTSLVKREFIFIPVGMANELGAPSFVKLLMSHQDAVLVLEDAEQALQSREKDFWNSSTVSTLLNLTDGILGTLLNISIIATYNADKQSIDSALLRKGRLMFDYSFGKLNADDANKLAAHLHKPTTFIEPASLADVYNLEDDTNYAPPVQKSMGFGFTPPPTPK